MSKHYVHKFKYKHDRRRQYFSNLIKQNKASVIENGRCYFVVDTGDTDYRISRKGRVIKVNHGQQTNPN